MELSIHNGSPLADVMRCETLGLSSLRQLARKYSVAVCAVKDGVTIPGSYWGDSEAGLIGQTLYVRGDTPVHSALHELCHYVCMTPVQRETLNTDAGGDYDEENAVCFLQIVLADELCGFDHDQMLHDMDSWGYTFRLGSAHLWFERDAQDAQQWLVDHHIINTYRKSTWRIRQ